MNITMATDSSILDKDFYRSLTPKKVRTFSESMIRRRIPFLGSDNQNTTYFLKLEKSSTKKSSSLGKNKDIPGNEMMSQSIETQTENYLNETETTNSIEISQISGYYTESYESNSKLEDSFFINQIEPLKNSTFICQQDISEHGSKTNEYQSIYSLNKTKNCNKINIYETNVTDKETNQIKTIICESNKDTNEVNTVLNGSLQIDLNKNPIPKKYPNYQPQNFQIPLIVINEIEIIDNTLKSPKTDTRSKKTLKVPGIPRRTDYEENRELQKKLVEMDHLKQIKLKDNVMIQLLEISSSTGFPKLRHICNLECEKNKNGFCKKTQLETENNLKLQEDSGGFFSVIWSVIKYPFVATSHQIEGNEESHKIKDDETTMVKITVEEKEDKIKPNEVSNLKLNEVDRDSNDFDKSKLENRAEINENNKLLESAIDIETKNESENCNEMKADKEKQNFEKSLNTKNYKVDINTKKGEQNNNSGKAGADLNSDNKGGLELIQKQTENKINCENLNDLAKDEERNSEDKNLRKHETGNDLNETIIPLKGTETLTNSTKEVKNELSSEKVVTSKNNPEQGDKSNSKRTKVETNKTNDEVKKKSKSKKRFFFFFNTADKTKNDKKVQIKKPIDDHNTIESMEEKLEELEKAKLKIEMEKLAHIPEESIKKLDSFMAEKVKHQQMDSKMRSRRSDSF